MHAPALTHPRDASLPRSPDDRRIGTALAVLVHVLLIAALAFSVHWHAHEPEGVAAELWSAVPQAAAPRPNTPPEPAARPVPPPRTPPAAEPKAAPPVAKVAPEPPRITDAQIALEKARRDEQKRELAEREEQRKLKLQQAKEAQKQQALKEAQEQAQKQEALRRQQAKLDAQRDNAEREKALADAKRRDDARQAQAARDAAERKKELAEQTRKEEAALAAQRAANLKQIQGLAGATGAAGSTGSALRSSGPSASYAGRIKARVKPNIVFTDSISGNPLATVEVRCAPDGTIISRKLIKASGNAAWDEAVLRAIDRTEVLPRDVDGSVPSPIQIEFRPRD